MFVQCSFELGARSNFKGTANSLIYVTQIFVHAFKLSVPIVACVVPQTELFIKERNLLLSVTNRCPKPNSTTAGRFSML